MLEEDRFNFASSLPNANLEFKIEGLALMYEKKDFGGNPINLKMRFPDVLDHVLRIEIRKNGMTYASFSVPVGSAISITHKEAVSTSSFDSKRILDFSKLHQSPKFLPERDVYGDLLLGKNSRSLIVENAKVEPYRIPDPNSPPGNVALTRFDFWKSEPNILDAHLKSRQNQFRDSNYPDGIVEAVVGGVEIQHGGATQIGVKGEINFGVELKYDSNANYKILISNHCDQSDCEFQSDFYHYYVMLEPDDTEFELFAPLVFGHRAPCNITFSSSDLG